MDGRVGRRGEIEILYHLENWPMQKCPASAWVLETRIAQIGKQGERKDRAGHAPNAKAMGAAGARAPCGAKVPETAPKTLIWSKKLGFFN